MDCRGGDDNRHSLVSTSETYPVNSQGFDSTTLGSSDYQGNNGSRSRHDSNQLLMLPAPLSVTRPMPSSNTSMATSAQSRSTEDVYDPGTSHARLIPSQATDYGDVSDREPSSGKYGSPTTSFESQVSKAAGNTAVFRQSTVSARYPGETQNPFRLPEPHGVAAMDYDRTPISAEPEPMSPGTYLPSQPASAHSKARGISLADNGPVPGPDGVRRVARRRPTSQQQQQQQPPQNRYSRNSGHGLPPGAAPPQPGGGAGGYY